MSCIWVLPLPLPDYAGALNEFAFIIWFHLCGFIKCGKMCCTVCLSHWASDLFAVSVGRLYSFVKVKGKREHFQKVHGIKTRTFQVFRCKRNMVKEQDQPNKTVYKVISMVRNVFPSEQEHCLSTYFLLVWSLLDVCGSFVLIKRIWAI